MIHDRQKILGAECDRHKVKLTNAKGSVEAAATPPAAGRRGTL